MNKLWRVQDLAVGKRLTDWRSGSINHRMNEVTLRWARLVLGWMSMFHLSMKSSQLDQLSLAGTRQSWLHMINVTSCWRVLGQLVYTKLLIKFHHTRSDAILLWRHLMSFIIHSPRSCNACSVALWLNSQATLVQTNAIIKSDTVCQNKILETKFGRHPVIETHQVH